MKKWITDFLSSDNDKSSRRLVFLLSASAFLVHYFLITYIKVEIKNEKLLLNAQDWLGWIILGSGCLVGLEKFNIGGKKSEPPTQ